MREARPSLGLCPANAPRRPAGVAKDIALLPLTDRAKPRYPTRKGALWRTLFFARVVKSWGKDPHALTPLAGSTTLSHYIFLSSYGLKRRCVRFTPSERVSIYVRVKRADVNSEFSRRA